MRQVARRHGPDVSATRDARSRRRRRASARHRRPRSGHRRDRRATPATPWCWRPAATATLYYLSTNAMGCNVTAIWRAYKRGAFFANPVLHADSSDVHSGQRRTPVEADADVRDRCATTAASGCPKSKGDTRPPERDPRGRTRLLSGAQISELRQPRAARRRLARREGSRATKAAASGRAARGVYLDFADAIERLGTEVITRALRQPLRHVRKITGENPYQAPMRIYPAVHYTMGGLWVDYNLMSNVPGLFVLGEANFSDHGANRLGASALMQGLADGYFVIPVHDRRLPRRRLSRRIGCRRTTPSSRSRDRSRMRGSIKLLSLQGQRRSCRVLPSRAGRASVGRRAAWRATKRA